MREQLQKWVPRTIWLYARKYARIYERPLTVLTGAAFLSTLVLNFEFNFLEANLYDFRVTRTYSSDANSDVVLITLDDDTSRELDQFSPLSLQFHTLLLETLSSAKPKAVGYLVDMNRVLQLDAGDFGPWGPRFVSAAQRLLHNGAVFLLGTPFDVTGEITPPTPLETLPHAVAVLHKDGNVFAEDKVTRRALLTLYDRPAFHLDMARRIGALGPEDLPPGSFYIPQVDGKYFFFRYHHSAANRNLDVAAEYPRYSFIDILKRRIPLNRLHNKILLVGTLSSDDSADFALTPYSKVSHVNPKLVIHANILDSILKKEGIIRLPAKANILITFLLTAMVLWWIMTSTPIYGVFATLTLALVFIGISHLLFQIYGLWIRESQPLVGILVSYYLAVPYRLVREYKKRWDYQRKHELLTQVEELKTNFLSLVTHDLKTPVARIQGLAEVLLRKASMRLLPQDIETLKHVIASTEELNHFISSILELSRVESNPIQIQPQSWDINQLIEKSVENFKAKALSRKIQIHANLEPLFPIKIDAALISKVLNNMIDNAVKYSNDNSEITIESKEVGDWTVVSVKDQGIGMTEEERRNLFTRFYRAKNDTTTSISGTGLGLYLTKYFVEAHRGRVEVESEPGKGSVFRIFLPLNEQSAGA